MPVTITPDSATSTNQGYGEPVALSQAETVAKGLRIEPNDPFALKAHPTRWSMYDDPDTGKPILLPVLGRLSHSPGMNNVDHRGNPAMAYGKATTDGWLPIPSGWCTSSDTPDGQPGYLRSWRTSNGRRYYDTVWARPYSVGNSIFFGCDAGYIRWVKRLVVEGKIPACPPEVKDKLIAQAEKRRTRHLKAAGSNPYEAGLVKDAEEMMERIKAASIPGEQAIDYGMGEIPEADELPEIPVPPTRTRKAKES